MLSSYVQLTGDPPALNLLRFLVRLVAIYFSDFASNGGTVISSARMIQ
jgi:hypothetical protein